MIPKLNLKPTLGPRPDRLGTEHLYCSFSASVEWTLVPVTGDPYGSDGTKQSIPTAPQAMPHGDYKVRLGNHHPVLAMPRLTTWVVRRNVAVIRFASVTLMVDFLLVPDITLVLQAFQVPRLSST
jgi:hypothetical protein